MSVLREISNLMNYAKEILKPGRSLPTDFAHAQAVILDCPLAARET
jgi:hypothetical protein